MASTVPLKLGEVLVPIKGTTWDKNQWKELEIMSSATVKGVSQYWVKMTDQHGFTTMDTLNIGTLRSGWVRKDSFFKVGKTYKFEANKWTVSDLYRVIEVAHVDDPLTPNDDVIAFVIAKDSVSGRQYGTSLTRNDFSKMVLA
ncbi:hypothetical protein HWB40_gp27 [Streptomyces phage Manuel]|uniref:Uncharacterized protein n=1 Tax=Streptomyces phage Manuel TaxID=2053812 RepID=A0A2H4PR13_9CAUD|nr:hypothetical protein HWB40_gp27 [Streptomyces phage Manuel]ATW69365.1 hypothetical protein SEA_MANUEL_71 [Streptomyces phage Manuel]